MAEQIAIETLEATDGVNLYCEVFASCEAKGVIIALHDYGEHIGLYREIFLRLSREGYKVYAQDLRGHGQSPTERGYISSFDDYLEDLDLLWARVADREANQKIHILGQGLGALIAAQFAFTRRPQCDGLILCGLILDLPIKTWQKQLLRYSGSILARACLIPELNQILLPSATAGKIKDDPLVFQGPVRGNVIREVLGACKNLQELSPQLNCAVLTIQSQHSSVSNARTLGALMDSILAVDKTQLNTTAGDHHLLLQADSSTLIGDIIQWCHQHSRQPSFATAEDDEQDDESAQVESLHP